MQVCVVFGQSSVSGFAVLEEILYDVERVFDSRTHLRFEPLQALCQISSFHKTSFANVTITTCASRSCSVIVARCRIYTTRSMQAADLTTTALSGANLMTISASRAVTQVIHREYGRSALGAPIHLKISPEVLLSTKST